MNTAKKESAQMANDVKNEAKNVARMAKNNPWVDKMARIGYATRGIIYGLMGYLAIQSVFSGRGKVVDQQGVLNTIASRPYGKYLLTFMAIGLVGMLIWGIIRAVADPLNKGSDIKGIIARVGYFISGLIYGALLLPTLNLIKGSGNGGNQGAQGMAVGLMGRPGGKILLILIGLVMLGVGIYQIYSGLNVKFNTRFESFKMTAQERKLAITMGRIGTAALGVVLIITGTLTTLAATRFQSGQIATIDQALLFLVKQPYGPYLLGLVAMGLIAYAVYSFMGAMWFRISRA